MKEKAFIGIYIKNFKPWKGLLSLTEEVRNTEVSGVFVISRWDGKIGFPGGYIEEGETAIEGALRELEEETSIIVEPEELELISADNGVYFYGVEKTIEEVIRYQKEMCESIDYGTEIIGSTILYLGDYKDSFKSFMSYPFVKEAKVQLIELIKQKELKNDFKNEKVKEK